MNVKVLLYSTLGLLQITIIIMFNNISESKEAACPHWTYHTPRNSSCRCGDSIYGVVKCTDDKSPVYVLSCHCMTLSDWGTVVEGICPYLCINGYMFNPVVLIVSAIYA